MRFFRIQIILAVILFAACVGQAQTNIREIADRVDRHYNGLRTLQTEFTQIYTGAGISRTESGTLWLKRPGQMRWEYVTPREKLFVTDGHSAWFYVPGEKQVRKMSLKKLDDLRTPLAYLLGKTRLDKEFSGLSLAPDVAPSVPGDVVLRGVPRSMADRVTDVLLEVTPEGRFQRILAHEVDGSTTEFRFANQKENVPVSEARFKFSPPPGVETIRADELGQ
jgi:outer membrane lipoprotein carrier protein